MLLRLQRYNLDVKYKKGPLMYIADTLSCAYLDEMVSCEEVKSLELVAVCKLRALLPLCCRFVIVWSCWFMFIDVLNLIW